MTDEHDISQEDALVERRTWRARIYGGLGLLPGEPRKVRAWGALGLGGLGLVIQFFGLARNPEIAFAFLVNNPLTSVLPITALLLGREARAEQKRGRAYLGLFVGIVFFALGTQGA